MSLRRTQMPLTDEAVEALPVLGVVVA